MGVGAAASCVFILGVLVVALALHRGALQRFDICCASYSGKAMLSPMYRYAVAGCMRCKQDRALIVKPHLDRALCPLPVFPEIGANVVHASQALCMDLLGIAQQALEQLSWRNAGMGPVNDMHVRKHVH